MAAHSIGPVQGAISHNSSSPPWALAWYELSKLFNLCRFCPEIHRKITLQNGTVSEEGNTKQHLNCPTCKKPTSWNRHNTQFYQRFGKMRQVSNRKPAVDTFSAASPKKNTTQHVPPGVNITVPPCQWEKWKPKTICSCRHTPPFHIILCHWSSLLYEWWWNTMKYRRCELATSWGQYRPSHQHPPACTPLTRLPNHAQLSEHWVNIWYLIYVNIMWILCRFPHPCPTPQRCSKSHLASAWANASARACSGA